MPDLGLMRGFSTTGFTTKLFPGTTEASTGGGLLLDVFSNALVAFSLRLLKSDYSGPAIRVRRASDNNELDIYFAGKDLDEAAIQSFCSGTNGFVTTWYDQSGNGSNAVQLASANQGLIYTAGAFFRWGTNLKPVINMSSGIFYDHPLSLNQAPSNCSFFCAKAIRTGESNTWTNTLDNNTNSPAGVRTWYYDGGVQAYIGGFNSSNKVNVLQNIFHISSNVWTNGSLVNTVNNLSSISYIVNGITNVFSTTNRINSEGGEWLGENIIYAISQNENNSAIISNMNTYYGVF